MRALIDERHFLINLIPLSPDRADERRVGGVILELLAQLEDVHHDGVGRAGQELLVPDILVELARGHGCAAVGDQVLQQLKLRLGHLDGAAVFAHGALVAVDLERVDDRWRVALAVVDAVAADERIDPQEQLVVGKGLDEIVVAAAAVGVAHVGGLGLRRQKQDRRDAVPPDLRAGGHAVHAGHHDVENDEVIVRLRAHELHGAQAVFGLIDLVAARREQNV